MHYTTSLVINSMLLSLILADGEARSFFKHKFLAWKEVNMFHLWKNNVFKRKYKIGPISGIRLEVQDHENKCAEIVSSAINVNEHEDLAAEKDTEISTPSVLENVDLLWIDIENNVCEELTIVDIE